MRPRIRTVKPELWKDERVGALSRDARLLYVGLVTMADDEGRFRALASGISGDLFQYDDDAPRHLKKWVAEVRDSGMVLFYVAGGNPYGAFRHWAKHQRINKPSPSEMPAPPDERVVFDNGLVWTGRSWKQRHGNGTDPDGNGRGVLPDNSGNGHGVGSDDSSSPRERAFRSDPDPVVVDLCQLLAARIRENDPKADPNPLSDRWRTDMRLLLQKRDGDADEIRRIIEWSQGHYFWRSNILSPGKLKDQFTQLVLKSQPPSGVVHMSEHQAEKQARRDRGAAALDALLGDQGVSA